MLLLGDILSDQKLLAPGRCFPVHVLDIIANDILPELIKVHTPALIDGIVRTIDYPRRCLGSIYGLISLHISLYSGYICHLHN